MNDDKPAGPGYVWSPGSSPQDNPLLIVVAMVIASVLIGAVVLGLVVG